MRRAVIRICARSLAGADWDAADGGRVLILSLNGFLCANYDVHRGRARQTTQNANRTRRIMYTAWAGATLLLCVSDDI